MKKSANWNKGALKFKNQVSKVNPMEEAESQDDTEWYLLLAHYYLEVIVNNL